MGELSGRGGDSSERQAGVTWAGLGRAEWTCLGEAQAAAKARKRDSEGARRMSGFKGCLLR